jgi:ADP-heptose:LPS heptosyltransferase
MWPAAHFLSAAQWLERNGLRAVFIGGPGEDLSAFAAFDTRPGRTLEDTKSLLAGATLFLGNDSGPAHMAAAFGLPVTVLYGSSDPVVWAPWRTRHEIFHAPEGLASIAPAPVIAALERLLA